MLDCADRSTIVPMAVGRMSGSRNDERACLHLQSADHQVGTRWFGRPGFRLKAFTLRLPAGVTAVVGVNGAGKSTFMKVLCGLARTGIRVRLGEREFSGVTDPRWRTSFGYVPQAAIAPRAMKVSRFIEYAAWLKGIPASRVPELAGRAVAETGLGRWADHPCGKLSGGTLRRVQLAAAIVHRPRVLLLDEPTTALDPVQRARFHETVSEGFGGEWVLMATHLIDDISASASHCVVLREGALAWQGAIGDLAAEQGGLGQALLRRMGDS